MRNIKQIGLSWDTYGESLRRRSPHDLLLDDDDDDCACKSAVSR